MKLLGGKDSGAIHERLKSRQGVREQDNILLAAVFLGQVFCGSFQDVKLYSVCSWSFGHQPECRRYDTMQKDEICDQVADSL